MSDGAIDDLNEIYRSYAGRIYRYCLFRMNSSQDAEDIAAEVFIRYLERGPDLEPDSILPWLFKVAGNLCIDHRRKVGRLKPLEGEDFHAVEPPWPWEDDEARRFLSTLKPKQQQVIFLKSIEDMSFKEIASFLGKRESAVKGLFYRGIRQLRALLKEAEIDEYTQWAAQRSEV